MERLWNVLVLWLVLMASSASAVSAADGNMILVGGATGRQGAAVVEQLLSRGYALRALSRDPSSDESLALKEKGIEVVQGDYGDMESLVAAMEGIDKVFFYSGFSVDEEAEGENVVAAAQNADVRHLVYSSGAAAEPGVGVAGSSKMQVESAIVDSGVPYTVLRPVAFMENFDRQQKRIAKMGVIESRGPDRQLSFIAIQDIGFLVAEAFADPEQWVGQAINIAGDTMTVSEYVETFSDVMGREVAYTQMPLEEYLETLPKPLRPLFRWYDEVGYNADVAALRAQYPNLITLDQYLRSTGWEDWQE